MQLFRYPIIVLVIAVLALPFPRASFGQKPDKHADEMKARIQQLGTGPRARVKLQLRNGQRFNGYVSEIKDKTFIVVSDQSGAATEIEYGDAKKAPWKPSTALVIVFAAGAVLGVTVLAGLIGGARGE